jgi:predicted RNA-binding Zn-ribbon protein involved in translation (DUF1610 family)
MLECDYCGTSYTVKEIEGIYANKDAVAEAQASKNLNDEGEYSTSGENWGAEGMKVYSCPSCGAELICDETTAATSCPYCGNPSIIPGQFTEMQKPDYVLPFKLDKPAAEEALRKYYKGKMLLPKRFTSENHIQEIKGVYVPFWLYDGEADVDASYLATKVFVTRRGNEEITTTEHYQVRRAGTVDFTKIPVDASSKMPNEHMDSIEPFDYSELKPFSKAYLPGFLADKYDEDVDKCSQRADTRAKNTSLEIMRNSVQGYATCIPQREDVRIRRKSVKYALLPVWMLSTQWNGKNYLFAMNGQTGKFIGNLPISKGKLIGWFAGISVPLMAIMYLLLGG